MAMPRGEGGGAATPIRSRATRPVTCLSGSPLLSRRFFYLFFPSFLKFFRGKKTLVQLCIFFVFQSFARSLLVIF